MDDWQARVDAIWVDDTLTDADRIARIDTVAADAPDEAHACFERAGARDSAGEEAQAEPLYRRALDLGLPEDLRAQAVIQLASTLRNLGHVAESLELLRAERERGGPMKDAASAFYALALTSSGDPLAAVTVALETLAPHLPMYTRAVAAYAAEVAPPR